MSTGMGAGFAAAGATLLGLLDRMARDGPSRDIRSTRCPTLAPYCGGVERVVHDLRWIRRLRIVGAVNAVLAVPVLVLLVEHPLDEAVGVVLAIGNGWSTGFLWARYLTLTDRQDSAKEPDRTVNLPERERQTALAWLDEKLGAYPNLWPHSATIIAAANGVMGAVAVALLN